MNEKKTLYINGGANVIVSEEGATSLNSSREAISRLYLMREDMHVVYGSGEDKEEFDANKGDLVIVFYDHTYKNKIITVNSEKWAENILDYEEREQKRKEEWAARMAEKSEKEPTDEGSINMF